MTDTTAFDAILAAEAARLDQQQPHLPDQKSTGTDALDQPDTPARKPGGRPAPVRVKPRPWRHGDGRAAPAVEIRAGARYVVVPLEQARRVADELHDAADAHEAGR